MGVVHWIRIFMPARVYADYLCLTFKIFYFSGTVWPQVYRWHLMCVCSDQYEWKEFVLVTIFYRRQGKQIFILVANCLNFSHFCNPTWRRALLGYTACDHFDSIFVCRLTTYSLLNKHNNRYFFTFFNKNRSKIAKITARWLRYLMDWEQ